MPNVLSPELLLEMFSQESGDPFLALLTLEHPDFVSPIRLVNNTEDIVSRTETYTAFPFNITLPADNGESSREVQLEIDNVSGELIDEVRSVTTAIQVKVELILASLPDEVQYELEELKMRQISYNASRISATLFLDNFLNTELTSERYGPTNFPGLF